MSLNFMSAMYYQSLHVGLTVISNCICRTEFIEMFFLRETIQIIQKWLSKATVSAHKKAPGLVDVFMIDS